MTNCTTVQAAQLSMSPDWALTTCHILEYTVCTLYLNKRHTGLTKWVLRVSFFRWGIGGSQRLSALPRFSTNLLTCSEKRVKNMPSMLAAVDPGEWDHEWLLVFPFVVFSIFQNIHHGILLLKLWEIKKKKFWGIKKRKLSFKKWTICCGAM